MRNNGKSRSGLATLAIIVLAAVVLKSLLPALAFLFKLVAGLAGLGILALVVALVVSSAKGKGEGSGSVSNGPTNKSSNDANFGENKNPYSSGKNTYSTVNNSAQKVVDTEAVEVGRAMTAEEARIMNETGRILLDARLMANRIKNPVVRDTFGPVLDKGEKIINQLKKEPDHILNAKQFINYYIPTLDAVLRKYLKLEGSGVDITSSTEKILSFAPDIAKAFEKQYNSFFDDDKLDLSVEMETMSLALKRDGLITTSDYITKEEMEKIELTV